MAARINRRHQDAIREKIRASAIINHLHKHIFGSKLMSASQVTAALGLLKKIVPDRLTAEHSGEVTVNNVARLPAVEKSSPEWSKQYSPTHEAPAKSQ